MSMHTKQVQAEKPIQSRPQPSKKLLDAMRRMEAIQNATRYSRIVAREDDVDCDLLAAIAKADCCVGRTV